MTVMTRRAVGTAVALVALGGSALVAPGAAQAAPAAGRTPSLSIKTNHTSYNYGHSALITIHLGATHGNRKVTLIAAPYGHKRVSETHTVGPKGNFTDTFGKLDRTTTFYARFAGDDRYAARTVKVVRKVHAKIVTDIKGGYATKHGYRYVHSGKKGYYFVGIAPNKAKQHLKFTLQRYRSGKWHTIQKTLRTLNKKSIAGVSITASPGYYRVRAYFKGGKVNPAGYSRYGHFRYV